MEAPPSSWQSAVVRGQGRQGAPHLASWTVSWSKAGAASARQALLAVIWVARGSSSAAAEETLPSCACKIADRTSVFGF